MPRGPRQPNARMAPMKRSPDTTAIRQNSKANVCQSIYDPYAASGGTNAHDASAATAAITSTASLT